VEVVWRSCPFRALGCLRKIENGRRGLAPSPVLARGKSISFLNLPGGTQLASVGRRIGAYFLSIPLFIATLGIGHVIWGLIAWGKGNIPALQVLGMRVWRPETNKVAGFWFMALREIAGHLIASQLRREHRPGAVDRVRPRLSWVLVFRPT
jgi:hypothetical protein